LVSLESGFGTQLLTSLISKDLNCVCLHSMPKEELTSEIELALIDCRGLEVKEISFWLQKNLRRCLNVSLFNVPHTQKYERLIEWPKLNGLFYEDTRETMILQGIRRMLAGDLWLPRRLLAGHLESSRTTHPMLANISLTQRETDILRLMKHGASNAAIGQKLGLSENTIKSHLYKVYRKIGANNRVDAGNWARLNID